MEDTINRKQKPPIASILLWLLAAFHILAYALSLVHLIDYTISVVSVITTVLSIVIGVFLMLNKNYPLFFSAAAFAVASAAAEQFSFEGDILFGVVFPVLSILTVLLFLFVLGTLTMPFLASLEKVGKVLAPVPSILRLFITTANLINSLSSLLTGDSLSPYYTIGYFFRHYVVPEVLPDLIVGVLFAIIYYTLLDRVINPYAEQTDVPETAADPQPAYSVPMAGIAADQYTEIQELPKTAAFAQPAFGASAETANRPYGGILIPPETGAEPQPTYNAPAAETANRPYGGILIPPETGAEPQPTYSAPAAETAKATEAAPEEYDKIYCPLVKHILLLLFTCGIWYLIWICRSTKFLNRAPETEQYSPVRKMLLVLFVPFYQIFWFYRHGQKLERLLAANHHDGSNMAALCLIFGILAPFAACILMQDRYNLLCTAAVNRAPAAPASAPSFDRSGMNAPPTAPVPDYFGIRDTVPAASSPDYFGIRDTTPSTSSPDYFGIRDTAPATPVSDFPNGWNASSAASLSSSPIARKTAPAASSPAPAAVRTTAPAMPAGGVGEDPSDDGSEIVALFIRYKQQLDAGIMTEEEFAEKKKRLLGI